jgi:3-methyl-2-oxobutanoate hydroxymethyltransferase
MPPSFAIRAGPTRPDDLSAWIPATETEPNMAKPITILDLQRMREQGKPITMVTAYDYPTAKLADESGVDVILVGDTLGMVVLGYDSTLPVTVEDMIHHGKAVVRGAKRAHVVIDMPFGSYQGGWQDALNNATRIIKETGCGSVKLEGGQRSAETVRHLVEAGIPVMGHIGLTPQSVNQTGGFRVQGKTPRDAVHLISDAKALDEAGAYAIVLELVPTALAHMITQRVHAPTIGIGAGPFTNGQVQVWHDILGLYDDLKPRHARRFAEIGDQIRAAVREYAEAVRSGSFPTAAESFYMDEHALELIRRMSPSAEHDMSEAERVLRELEDVPSTVD